LFAFIAQTTETVGTGFDGRSTAFSQVIS